MAKKNITQEEIAQSKEALAIDYKEAQEKWNSMTPDEKYDKVAKLMADKIIKNVMQHVQEYKQTGKDSPAFFQKNMSKEEINATMPYNPKTGKPIMGITSFTLRNHSERMGFQENAFLTLKQANELMGDPTMKAVSVKPLLDEQGNTIPVIKQNGEEGLMRAEGVQIIVNKPAMKDKVNENGELIYRADGSVAQEPDPYQRSSIEKSTYYNIEQLVGLDPSKLKERDLSQVEKIRHEIQNTDKAISFKMLDRMGLRESTKREAMAFMQAEMKNIDFKKVFDFEKDKSQDKTQTKSPQKRESGREM